MKKLIFLLCFILYSSLALASEDYTPEALTTNRYEVVQDKSAILSIDERNRLIEKIKGFEQASSNELAIVTIDSLEGKNVHEVALQTAQKMGVGKKDKNNGILILLVVKDKKISVQVGEGLEGVYPDVYAKQAIDVSKPFLKSAKYYEGLDSIVSDVILKTSDEFVKNNPVPVPSPWYIEHWFLTLLLVLFVLDLLTWHWKGDLIFLYILMSMGSGGGSSSSSRGSSSFGGGSFGGGGSSSGW